MHQRTMHKDDKQLPVLLPPDLQQRLERANLEVIDEYRRRLDRQARLAECIRARFPAAEHARETAPRPARAQGGLRVAAILALAVFAVPGALLLTGTHNSVANAQAATATAASPAPLTLCADGASKAADSAPKAAPIVAAPPPTGTSWLPPGAPLRKSTASLSTALRKLDTKDNAVDFEAAPVAPAPAAAPASEPVVEAEAPKEAPKAAPKSDLSVAARTANLLREQLVDSLH